MKLENETLAVNVNRWNSRYRCDLLKCALTLVGNYQAAETLIQKTFSVAWRRSDSVRAREDESEFLMRTLLDEVSRMKSGALPITVQ